MASGRDGRPGRRQGNRPAAPGSGGHPPRPRTPVDAPRLAAFEALRAVTEEDAYANLVLPGRLGAHGLSGRDAGFTTELVAGSLRWQGTYDAVLEACLTGRSRLEPAVRDVLRLGVHQLLGMRVSSHAAVSTSVDLVRLRVGPGPAGLVNAVLRRVSAHDLQTWVRMLAPDPATDPHGFAALAHAHPRWVVDELAAALGTRAAELPALLAADNEPPRVTLVARPGLADRAELIEAGATPTPWSPWGATLRSGDPGELAAVAEGRAGVQDEGSQLVAAAVLAAVPFAGHRAGGERWLDTCAGPGGKASVLGAVAAQQGARLLAGERQPHRAGLVAGALTAVPPGAAAVVVADGTVPAWAEGAFDRVLVDAPCTGLGALRRRPEARWRRSRNDLPPLVSLQEALLLGALDSVRPGGVVVYATCSPVLAETEGVVRAVLTARPDIELADAVALLPQVPDSAGPLPGTVQLWPHRHGTDAMFLALLRRPT
ncbi:MAG: 16S rRNA (cytosine(967)-C(5))-methyltransferase [uncultured Nocardioidaceae bacterium]|uniref:16S rRNA (Cytosine(967)-C(5))-methyltransferase n=1 Tax=uncultured Nocardioidaceae bacterium TaxID=253824 RepID=A0A6J4LUN4_9ACTN|nr:MAG: 16S rRNA (cytosine(967)-C(5))-methyltransferase [uncultured Nocardioidaceae bacterium]